MRGFNKSLLQVKKKKGKDLAVRPILQIKADLQRFKAVLIVNKSDIVNVDE